jgi:ligand-binding sensor domain-containing protein
MQVSPEMKFMPSHKQWMDLFGWVPTLGLVRFDGLNFTVFDSANTPAITRENIQTLAAAVDGSLWIGTEDGLLKFKDGNFTRYTERDGLAGNNINFIQTDRDGTLRVGTSSLIGSFGPSKTHRWSNGKF